MDRLLVELRSSLRLILKNPGFAAVAILSIGLGTGAVTAIFTVLDAVVLRPLPYAEPHRLVALWETNAGKGLERERISPVNFVDYRAQRHVFEDAAAWWYPELNLTDATGEPTRVKAIEASSNFFDVLGVAPSIGRAFPPSGSLFGPDRQVVISHRLWTQRYASDAAIVGKSIALDGTPHTVLGVMPPRFDYPGGTDLWIRLIWPLERHSRGAHFMESVGRLAPGARLEGAERELDVLSGRLGREFASTNGGWRTRLVPLDRDVAGIFRPALLVLLVSVSLLLLVACFNVANLLLARATTRAREVAIRAALGASRGRLLGQLLAESLLVAVFSTALGIVVAMAATRLLVAAAPLEIPRLADVAVNLRVLGFALGLTFATTIAFGLLPAWFLARADLHGALRFGGGRAVGASRGSLRARNALVVAEVMLAVSLVFVAGLLMQSFSRLMAVDPGFRSDGAIAANVQLPQRGYDTWEQVSAFYERLLQRLGDHPQVAAAGVSNFMPFEAGWRMPIEVLGEAPRSEEDRPVIQHITTSEAYFSALGARLVSGRPFAPSDTARTSGVVIVNQAAARRLFRGADPLGRRILSTGRVVGPLGRALLPRLEYEVVGVVSDVRNTSLREPAEAALYFSYRQFPFRAMHLVVRTRGASGALPGIVRKSVREVDAGLPLVSVRTLDAFLGASTGEARFLMLLMSVFAALALGLASLGIYGLLSYVVGQRRAEIGIRMALGAQRRDIVRLVARQGGALALAGVAAGVFGALALGRAVSSLLFVVSPADPWTLAAVLATVAAAAALACLLPAGRAARIDPQIVLRAE